MKTKTVEGMRWRCTSPASPLGSATDNFTSNKHVYLFYLLSEHGQSNLSVHPKESSENSTQPKYSRLIGMYLGTSNQRKCIVYHGNVLVGSLLENRVLKF